MIIEKSIVRRYLVLSVIASTLPVLAIGLMYDHFTGNALEQLLGEKMSTHLTATANRLGAYIESRRYQLETLANYPGIDEYSSSKTSQPSSEVTALLQIESDLPDLYGILFFDAQGRLQRVVPGQAAAGPPYWSDRPFETNNLPVTTVGETQILGPVAALDGDSGWLLVRHALHARQADQISGYIALHVRLASLTEQLGANAVAGTLQPLLRTPVGNFNTVGQSSTVHGKVIVGPEILPGWQPLLEVESDGVLKSFALERRALLLAVMVSAVLIVFLFFRLSTHLRFRIGLLLSGVDAISSGQLAHRIAEEGSDEIASVSHAFNAMSGKLQEYLARAVHMEKLAVLGEFATGIAHEIRNPLAALKTSAQALARREQDPKRAQLLAEMEGEIDRLARVVSDLVDFGRPRPAAPGVVLVRDLLRRVLPSIEPEALQRGVHLSCQGDSDLEVWADPDHLLQIVLNLALNAVQATPPGGTVVLRAFAADAQIAMEVSDTGCGIPKELLNRVSDPFFTTKTRGVGLGLSISRQLCELNNGQMSLDSAPGHGTVVRITLPNAKFFHANHPDH
ncbi:HAMP domain-containing sensor histidine kinase [Rhodoferax sp.]|uniref:HAMP domain-containing sensor histidine kinase n=1 Tax=Rhodoferax sp. TaxID=50421 RepID=UPI002609DB5C|nr:HAMP domain-containing sensor histidine kinase [Rhodoferax sp.]MDD2919114.1 ATP-binding protein [Rhodoferax sp.]